MPKIKRKTKRTIRKVFLFCVVILICLIFAEVLLRIFTQPHYGNPPGMFIADEVVDYTPKPGFEGYFINQEHPDKKIKININNRGFRDKEYSIKKEKETTRIVTLGDSFTMAEQVQIEETYSKLLETTLNKEEKKYEVLNLGVSGYGTNQAFKFFKMKGAKYEPEIVIYSFTTNDLTDNTVQKYTVRYGERLNAEYDESTSLILPIKVFLYRNSALLRSVYRTAKHTPKKVKNDIEKDYFEYYGGEESWNVLRETLTDMKDYFEERETTFIVLYNTPIFRISDEKSPFDRERLTALTEELDILFIDPTEEIIEAGGESLYFPRDGHWNMEGHRFIGQLLSDYIRGIKEQ